MNDTYFVPETNLQHIIDQVRYLGGSHTEEYRCAGFRAVVKMVDPDTLRAGLITISCTSPLNGWGIWFDNIHGVHVNLLDKAAPWDVRACLARIQGEGGVFVKGTFYKRIK